MPRRNQRIIVVGCGRLGKFLATQFSAEGHHVQVIDPDRDRLDKLPPEFGGQLVEGDGTELAVLRQANALDADQIIAVTQDDNINLLIAQIAKEEFKVPRVVARVNDPHKEEIFDYLGIEAVCPLTLARKELLINIRS